MSLKVVHIAFVTIAVLACGGFAAWAFRQHQGTGESMNLLMAGVSAAIVVALLVYGVWFIRKTKGYSLL